MRNIIGALIIILLFSVSIAFSILFKDFSILVIGALLNTIFIAAFFNLKFFSKKLLTKAVHSKHFRKEENKLNHKFSVLDSSKIRLISEKSIVFVLGVIAFSYLAVYKYEQEIHVNVIIDYLKSSYIFFKDSPLFLFVILLLLTGYFLIGLRRKLKLSAPETFRGFGLIILSYLFSLLAVFLIGFLHVGLMKLSYSNSGFITDKKLINNYLARQSSVPKLFLYDNQAEKKFIISDLSDFNGNSNYYENNILSIIPNNWYKIAKFPTDAIFIFKDFLVIREINQTSVEDISPTLGRTIVRVGIPQKNIKSEPKIDVLNRQEYLRFREDQINQSIEKMELLIDEIQTYINNNYARINEAKSKIQSNRDGIDEAIVSREQSYNNCKSAGYTSYYFGTFYRLYTDAECEARKQNWDAVIVQYQKNITDWEKDLRDTQYYLSENQKIKEELLAYRELISSQKNQTPNELGIFLPEKDIKLALDTTQKDYLKEYVATLIHEYLHYTSYVSEERVLEHSLEEGITEFISRKIMNENFGNYKGLGYPIMVRIVEEISRKISYNDLLDIYFTKDQERLEYLLDQMYGKNFYKDSELYFQIINLLPPDKALKIANNILVRMGGDVMLGEDLK